MRRKCSLYSHVISSSLSLFTVFTASLFLSALCPNFSDHTTYLYILPLSSQQEAYVNALSFVPSDLHSTLYTAFSFVSGFGTILKLFDRSTPKRQAFLFLSSRMTSSTFSHLFLLIQLRLHSPLLLLYCFCMYLTSLFSFISTLSYV